MGRLHRAQGFTLVEVLLASVLTSLTLIAFLSLTMDEVRHAQAIIDRSEARCLARNLVSLFERGYRDELRSGAAQADGSYLLMNPHEALQAGALALGPAQAGWVNEKKALGSFQVSARWNPTPPAAIKPNGLAASVGLLVVRVEWKTLNGEFRWYRERRLLSH